MKRLLATVSIIATLLASVMLAGCNIDPGQVSQLVESMAKDPEKTQEIFEEAAEAENTAQQPEEETPKQEEEAPSLPTKDIYIIYTSDIHCGVDQGFGYVGLEQIRANLEAKGCDTILVDNGDAVQGELIGTVSSGEAIIPIMNALKYDVAIPGNHEFDYGMDEFVKYTEMADFPYISCNFRKDGKLVFEPYLIKEAGGKKFAFVGVTTPETMTSVSPKTFADADGNYIYGFMQGDGSGLYAAVQDAVDSARAEGADYVYVLGHVGNIEDAAPYNCMDIIANTTGIDVFLDGHSHDTDQMTIKNKDGVDVTRSACGTKFNAIGYSHIIAEDGSVETGIWEWENNVSAPELLNFRNGISDIIEKEQKEVEEKTKEVVAKTDVDLTINDPEEKTEDGTPIRIVRSRESNLGDLCADAVRIMTGSDIGIVNGGGVRTDIRKGDVTYGDIINVHPFGNINVVIEVTGQQIADALEWSCRSTPGEEGGFLQVSGISFKVNTKITSGCTKDENGLMTGIKGERRVSDIKVGGKDLDPDAKYTVAGNAFILTNNGNGYTSFDGAKVTVENAGLDNQLLIDYIVNSLGGTIGDDYADPYGQGRIEIDE